MLLHLKDRPAIQGPGWSSFPQIYRVTGNSWDTDTGSLEVYNHLLPGEPVESHYTFDPIDQGTLANAVFTPIDRLDPDIDGAGWLLVRKHDSENDLDGYMNALIDLAYSLYDRVLGTVCKNNDGFFTLVHRLASKGCEDNLIAYSQTGLVSCGGKLISSSIFHIAKADGTTTDDENILEPPEES